MTRTRTTDGRAAHPVDPGAVETLDVLGPTIAYLTRPEEGAPCVLRGTIPPGGSVPLHAHADPETFLMRSGEVEGLVMAPDGHRWVPLRAGEVFHVPGHARHAWRNRSAAPAVMDVVTTARLASFFREVGSPAGAGRAAEPPDAAVVRHFLEVSDRYGYWNATPEENARIGLAVAFAGGAN